MNGLYSVYFYFLVLDFYKLWSMTRRERNDIYMDYLRRNSNNVHCVTLGSTRFRTRLIHSWNHLWMIYSRMIHMLQREIYTTNCQLHLLEWYPHTCIWRLIHIWVFLGYYIKLMSNAKKKNKKKNNNNNKKN